MPDIHHKVVNKPTRPISVRNKTYLSTFKTKFGYRQNDWNNSKLLKNDWHLLTMQLRQWQTTHMHPVPCRPG